MKEPDVKRAYVFVDRQNLFHAARQAFGFPVGPGTTNRRGINATDWIRIDRPTYDACTHPTDYRPHRRGRGLR